MSNSKGQGMISTSSPATTTRGMISTNSKRLAISDMINTNNSINPTNRRKVTTKTSVTTTNVIIIKEIIISSISPVSSHNSSGHSTPLSQISNSNIQTTSSNKIQAKD
jgi:hypothetical protein